MKTLDSGQLLSRRRGITLLQLLLITVLVSSVSGVVFSLARGALIDAAVFAIVSGVILCRLLRSVSLITETFLWGVAFVSTFLGFVIPVLSALGSLACSKPPDYLTRQQLSLINAGVSLKVGIGACLLLAVLIIHRKLKSREATSDGASRSKVQVALGHAIFVSKLGILSLLVIWNIGSGSRIRRSVASVQAGVQTAERHRELISAITSQGSDALPAAIQALNDPDESIRQQAINFLGNLGPKAAPAVPALAAEALRQGLPPDPSRQMLVALALAEIGPDAKEAVPALTQLYQSATDNKVRLAAAAALGMIQGPQAKAVVPDLIMAVKAKETFWRICDACAEALGAIGPDAKEALPVLLQAIKDIDQLPLPVTNVYLVRLRDSALAAMKRIDPEAAAQAGVPLLLEALKSNDATVRRAAAERIGKLGGQARSAVPALTEALRDKNNEVAVTAAKALGDIGPEAIEAVPAIVQLANEINQASTPIEETAPRVLQRAAFAALERIDPQAAAEQTVPALVGALNYGPTRRAALDKLIQMSGESKEALLALAQAVKSEDYYISEDAVKAFNAMGTKGEAAVPALIENLKDTNKDVRYRSLRAIGAAGAQSPLAIQALVETLRHADPGTVWSAENVLGRIGPLAIDAVPALTNLLKHEAPNVRSEAAEALGKIGPDAKSSVPEMAKALKDPNEEVRQRAAHALGLIGPEAREAIPALYEALKDKKVWSSADWALNQMDSGYKVASPDLAGKLKSPDDAVRAGAVLTLGQMGPNHMPQVSTLVAFLKDTSEQVRINAARALLLIGARPTTSLLPALIEALKDKRPEVRCGVARVLQAGGAESKLAIPFLAQSLKDGDPSVRIEAAIALLALSPESDTVPLSLLLEGLQNPLPDVHSRAAYAIGKLGPAAKEAIPALVQILKKGLTNERAWAAIAIGNIGPEAKDVSPALLEALRDPSDGIVRLRAAEALWRIERQPTQVLPTLVESLKGANSSERLVAALVLSQMGPAAKDALPELVQAIKDSNVPTRHWIIQALSLMGSEAKSAIPALTELQNDPDPNIRQRAAQAVLSINAAK